MHCKKKNDYEIIMTNDAINLHLKPAVSCGETFEKRSRALGTDVSFAMLRCYRLGHASQDPH